MSLNNENNQIIQFTFPRKLRLSSSSHFSFVFQKSQKVEAGVIVIFGRLNALEYPRIGLSVSKKNVKHAHERNRVKRLIRESFRIHQHNLPNMDFVVVVRNGVTKLNNQSILKKMEKLWLRNSYI